MRAIEREGTAPEGHERETAMKVIASAIAAALATTTATVSLAAVIAIAPVATESA